MLHSAGSFFTNTGFGVGGAVLVQVVKLLEPIETLLFMALINTFIHAKPFQIPLRLLYKSVPVILGTGILLTSRDAKNDSTNNVHAATWCAFFSSILISSRNVIGVLQLTPATMPWSTTPNSDVVGDGRHPPRHREAGGTSLHTVGGALSRRSRLTAILVPARCSCAPFQVDSYHCPCRNDSATTRLEMGTTTARCSIHSCDGIVSVAPTLHRSREGLDSCVCQARTSP